MTPSTVMAGYEFKNRYGKKGNELDEIMDRHPELGDGFLPTDITVCLAGGFVYEGSILGAPVTGFGTEMNAIVSKAPKKFTHGGYTFRKTSESVITSNAKDVDYELAAIEIEGKTYRRLQKKKDPKKVSNAFEIDGDVFVPASVFFRFCS